MKLFKTIKSAYITTLSENECFERLNGAIETSFFPYFSSKKVVGSITDDTIIIRKKISYHNSFQPVLRATIRSCDQGTVIYSKLGLHTFLKVFVYFFFCFALLTGVIIFIINFNSMFIKQVEPNISNMMGLLIPIMLVMGGLIVMFIGKEFASDEYGYLDKFVHDLLELRKIDKVEQITGVGPGRKAESIKINYT